MAVQAQYSFNAFSPDLHSRTQAVGVLEGLQMPLNREHQSGHMFHSTRLQDPADDDQQQQMTATASIPIPSRGCPNALPTFNVPDSSRWRQNAPLSSMATAAEGYPQQPRFPNPAFLAVPLVPSTRLTPISLDRRLRSFNSAGTSTSGRPEIDSTQSVTPFSQELLMHIRDYNMELDAILNNYKNILREGIETQTRHWKSLLAMLEQMALQRLREKDAELENANRRNSELEEKILHLCSENQMWFNLASQNEALASNLKVTLEHIIIQNATADTAQLPAEGYGDTDGSMLHDNVALPYFKADEAHNEQKADGDSSALAEKDSRRMVCKVCCQKEISVLLLHCLHLCLCIDCDPKISTCPICSCPKSGSVEIFMS